MTKGEEETIRNIIARLKSPNAGCASDTPGENVSRVYIDTWLIGPLECLLPETRDVALAARMSRK